MEVDFFIALAVFAFIITFVIFFISNYLTSIQANVAEYREKALGIANTLFSLISNESFETNPSLIESISRIPVVIIEKSGYNIINEPIYLNISFDANCTKKAAKNTVMVYDENLSEIPSILSYSSFCDKDFLNCSLVTCFVNLTANSTKRIFIYFSNDTSVIAPGEKFLGLLAYYPLDENNGIEAKDYSGREKTAILKNGTQSCSGSDCPNWVNGRFNYGVSLDGINDYIDCGNIGNDIKTIEFWIKTDNLAQSIMQLSSNVNISLSNGAVEANGFVSPAIYVNGVKDGVIKDGVWNYVLITSNTSVVADNCKIGKVGENYFNGSFDEIRIWNVTKNEAYVLSRNSSITEVYQYPEESMPLISSRRLNELRNLSYEYMKGMLLEEVYKFRIEIYAKD